MIKGLSAPNKKLLSYVLGESENATVDQLRSYFRSHFPSFICESDANNADGYVPGKIVLEAKDNSKKWLSAFFQALAQGNELSFSLVVVATPRFLGAWKVSSLEKSWRDSAKRLAQSKAPNKVGEELGREYKDDIEAIKRKAVFLVHPFPDVSDETESEIISFLEEFREVLSSANQERLLIHPGNFQKFLPRFSTFFDQRKSLASVRNFYRVLQAWDKTSTLNFSSRTPTKATLGGEVLEDIKPDKRDALKEFVENHYVGVKEGQDFDDYFTKYDVAIDAVDPDFREDHGIYFTDINLSRFAMWYVKNQLGEIGSKYIIMDPACGSGNLVSNWRSPLQMKHKVISDLQPELLYAVEQRMKLDSWHRGKFTIVPKVEEDRGLNFINRSADDYLVEVKKYLEENNIEVSKPIAFLCNPPYSGKAATNTRDVNYHIDPSIVEAIGKQSASDSYAAFLAQMRLVTERAKGAGLKENSLLLLFTQCGWFSQKEGTRGLRDYMMSCFDDKGIFIVKANEFFEKTGNWPLAFSIWEYKGKDAGLNAERPLKVWDLTHLTNQDLSTINWLEPAMAEKACQKFYKSGSAVHLGVQRLRLDADWLGVSRKDLSRSPRSNDVELEQRESGLPRGDERRENKTIYGHAKGKGIGYCLDLTPARFDSEIVKSNGEFPWFYLDSRFQKINTNQCFSGIPDSRGYAANSFETFRKASVWYSVGKVLFAKGCPIWANQEELWEPDEKSVQKYEFDTAAMYYVLANNSCIDVTFPANNPVRGAAEVFCSNPLAINDTSSFWNTTIRSKAKSERAEIKATEKALKKVYKAWEDLFDGSKLYVNYDAPYFFEEKVLNRNAGIRQIREYQEHYNNTELGKALEELQASLASLEEFMFNVLIDDGKINYFGLPKIRKTGTGG